MYMVEMRNRKTEAKKTSKSSEKMITEIIIFKVVLKLLAGRNARKTKKGFDAENWTTLNFLFLVEVALIFFY
jgi:hypothetical protein